MQDLRLTNTQLQQAAQLFTTQYTVENTPAQAFAAPLVIAWNQLEQRIDEFSAHGLPLIDIALKMIHRYDPEDRRWYITVQACRLGTIAQNTLRSLTSLDLFSDIKPDGNLSGVYTNSDGMQGSVDSLFCPHYFSAVINNGHPLQQSTHVHSAIIAWAEFAWLLHDNRTTARPDKAQFNIVFNAVTSRYIPGLDSLVEYPHCVTIHMQYAGADCLNDAGTEGFLDKAANFNTLCPPKCPVYTWHTDLKPTLPS